MSHTIVAMNASLNLSKINTNEILVQATNITHFFGEKRVLQNIDLTLKRNEITTLIGPNGAGKSTLLKILIDLIQPTLGKIWRSPHLSIGFMPQKIQVDASLPMTVARFLKLGLRKPHFFSSQKTEANFTTELMQTVSLLRLEKLLNTPIQKVSGGEMQRVLLARALIRKPDLLVLDEPVQGVDLQGQVELYHLINEIKDTLHCGILMVSHDLHIVMKSTHQVLCLNEHICCSGHPQTVSESPAFKNLFGQEFDEIAIYEHHHGDTCDHTHGLLK
ncbi:ATP-binding cassette domain-containing protein [Hydrogenovibrio sp. JE_KL2]|uniref:ATP-binding cassette domain-containing protein n=1 Tax=Hydrogenovibrio sp. JE_KL2 TaxID=2651188 RepID=UPI00352A3DC2